jgi:2-polyprenyl-3-methyl-5-hydroxy-6-metoxy-1,4-benzoquinol methylase
MSILKNSKIDLNIMRPVGFHKNINLNIKKGISRVDKGSGWKKVSRCPVCNGNKKKLFLVKFKQNIFECQKCFSGYIEFVPRNFEVLYDNQEYYIHHQKAYEKNRNYRIERFGKERLKLLQQFKKKGNLIDIGCGNGWFLEAVKNHYNVHGLEMNSSLAKFTSQKLSINVFENYTKIKKNFYDIITLFDVIEHVEKPFDYITFLGKFLKKNGIILIFTPNKKSVAFLCMREDQNLVGTPFHVTYLQKESFSFIPKIFKMIFSQTRGLDIADIFAFERDNKKKILDAEQDINENLDKQNEIDFLGLGNHIRVVIKKIK